ncbi:hypothetical protein M2281_001287 [Mesorhizobium soli]|uniref:EVE domain-containing protein n=1 Tax=Pseudaminobacter soli (ex Li et al. 2025) TaxID=1295366 RepID=UPI00247526FB|nr:EVE domain-containing protein [Mesorhizobium soli]MDH6230715.1 hypothetical protein [Mesorhizobium soli]
MKACWLAVASADHVQRGKADSFMQVCHGKAGPLRRIGAGDGIVYYSPSNAFGGRDGLKSFTALGRVRSGDPYQVDMGGGFRPFRRDVDWDAAAQTSIGLLFDRLELTADRRNWGYQLRFGLLQLSLRDFCVIAEAMNADMVAAPRSIASAPRTPKSPQQDLPAQLQLI